MPLLNLQLGFQWLHCQRLVGARRFQPFKPMTLLLPGVSGKLNSTTLVGTIEGLQIDPDPAAMKLRQALQQLNGIRAAWMKTGKPQEFPCGRADLLILK